MITFCRLCLRSSLDMLPLFETLTNNKLLIEIILATLGIELDNSLDFPREICQDCLRNVSLLYDFHKKLIQTQSLLSRWKRDGKPIVEALNQLSVINSQENGAVLELNEDECYGQNSFIVQEPIILKENSSEIIRIKDEVIDSNQKHIENESITVKQNLLNFYNKRVNDDDEMDRKHRLVNKRTRKCSKEVLTIPNKCYICGLILESEGDFRDHLESHGGMLPHECSKCSTPTKPIILSTVHLLNKHFESHSFNYVCQACPLRFRTSNMLCYHRRTVHENHHTKHICNVCGKEMPNSILLQSHIRDHISLKLKRYKCKICERPFTSNFLVKRHMVTHKNRPV